MAKQLVANLQAFGHTVLFQTDPEDYDVALWIRPPHYVKDAKFNNQRKNVFFTMHETETFEGWKSDWAELLNKCTAIITPTEWNKTVFEKNGVTVPIHVIPLGVNSKDFSGYKTYPFSIITLHDALGSNSSREDWKATIAAYFDAFYNNHYQEVSMTIKSYNIKKEEYMNHINLLKAGKDNEKFPTIDVLDIDLEPIDLNRLYSKHWLFIKNANREGWSLPLLEAMSCGLVVAHTDLPVLSWTDGYKKRRVFQPGDIDELKKIILDEFIVWRKEKSFINQFSWRNCGRRVEEVLQNV